MIQTSADFDNINLSRILHRLEDKILSPTPNRRLERSSYERTKTAANLECARTLLLRLEHNTSSIKIQTRKQAAQTELIQQRNLIKRLNDRLYEFGQQDDGADSDSSSDEDLLGEDKSSPSVAAPSTAASSPHSPPNHQNQISPSPIPLTTIKSTLRNRTKPSSAPERTTSILEDQTSVQNILTTSLLSLATQLKNSSIAISASLEADKSLLSQTAAALDKNTDGMSMASERMGTLRKMSEGRWWWGRMLLYACIAGLWIFALVLVFAMPKFRF